MYINMPRASRNTKQYLYAYSIGMEGFSINLMILLKIVDPMFSKQEIVNIRLFRQNNS
jgi:hypothetical protein